MCNAIFAREASKTGEGQEVRPAFLASACHAPTYLRDCIKSLADLPFTAGS